VVLALALAGAEEVVEDEDDSLELERSEELELDCVTLALAEEGFVEEDSLVELESEDSVLVVDVLVLSIEDVAAELVCVELPAELDDVEEACTLEELLLDSDDDEIVPEELAAADVVDDRDELEALLDTELDCNEEDEVEGSALEELDDPDATDELLVADVDDGIALDTEELELALVDPEETAALELLDPEGDDAAALELLDVDDSDEVVVAEELLGAPEELLDCESVDEGGAADSEELELASALLELVLVVPEDTAALELLVCDNVDEGKALDSEELELANAVEDEDSVELARAVELKLYSVLLELALACVVDVEDCELEAEPLELGRLELDVAEIVLLDAAAVVLVKPLVVAALDAAELLVSDEDDDADPDCDALDEMLDSVVYVYADCEALAELLD
jgi:hypothetical protein